MELRYLETQDDRQLFEESLRQARARAGIGFSETHRSRVGRIHLEYGDVYGLFDERDNSHRMLAGFAIHGLDMFGQSYPKPDLTDLPPESVFEVGELWSCSLGSGVAARWGCALLAGLLRSQALLIYPIIEPWDLTGSYPGFEPAGTPVVWPYAQTTAGLGILVQPMVSRGRGLRALISVVSRGGFEAAAGNRVVRFASPLLAAIAIRQGMRRAAAGPHVWKRSTPQVEHGTAGA